MNAMQSWLNFCNLFAGDGCGFSWGKPDNASPAEK